MLNQITAFVESKILRKRAKTNEGRSVIRFGSKTVHLFDPSVSKLLRLLLENRPICNAHKF